MRVRVLHHDHCFDGAASAAFFTRFVEAKFYPGAEFLYTGMMHAPNQTFEESLFDGDVNAIVDFKYSSNDKLTWWFDHHQSAFLSPADAEHFQSSQRAWHFFNSDYKSCTKFIADIAARQFDFHAPDLAELVKWADIVDGAQYRDAAEAVEIASPATKLVLVIEGSKGSDAVHRIIRLMQREPLERILLDPVIASLFEPLYQRHLASMDIIRRTSVCSERVVFFDLIEPGLEGYNKFIPYYLHSDSLYTVSVLASPARTKVSVGSNPWAQSELKHNLASICERYGGGGHPRVGAISFPKDAVEQARAAAREIVAELQT